jgi:hypothetical protein|tara:strand:- start:60 stop:566 length:507 start_codon:yes stop_codon:yes gene_type:complete
MSNARNLANLLGTSTAISGSLVQQKQINLTTTDQVSQSTSTYTDLTGGSMSYTPKASGNILVIDSGVHFYVNNSTSNGWSAVTHRCVVDGTAKSRQGGDSSYLYGVGLRDDDGSRSSGMIYDVQNCTHTTTGTSAITIKLQTFTIERQDYISANEYSNGYLRVMEFAG